MEEIGENVGQIKVNPLTHEAAKVTKNAEKSWDFTMSYDGWSYFYSMRRSMFFAVKQPVTIK